LHLALLELVAGKNNKFPGLISAQDGLDKPPTKGACATRDKDDLAIKIEGGWFESAHGGLLEIGTANLYRSFACSA
jgi:hypothetical protein